MVNESGPTKRAVVVGSGLVGPVVAMFLQRAGLDPVVYEGRPEARDEVGAFLGVTPNGRDVLGTLGIRDEIEALGMPTPRLAFLNHQGKQLGANAQPVVTFERGVLSRGLRDAAEARGIEIRWGARLTALEQDRDAVAAHFADGSTAGGDLLVGADGIRSAVRRAILPDAPEPEYTGQIGSASYARVPGLGPTGGTMALTFGLNGFFGHQTGDDGETFWFENLYQKQRPTAGELEGAQETWRRMLMHRHARDHSPIPEILAASTGELVRYPIEELPVLRRWHSGRVVLVGDAAHAIGPHSGQGASMGFEDAVVLARCVRDVPDLATAFATYQDIRRARVDHVAHETRRVGNAKKPPGVVGRTVRDLVLPMFLRKSVDMFAGIHAHHVPWDEPVVAATRETTA